MVVAFITASTSAVGSTTVPVGTRTLRSTDSWPAWSVVRDDQCCGQEIQRGLVPMHAQHCISYKAVEQW